MFSQLLHLVHGLNSKWQQKKALRMPKKPRFDDRDLAFSVNTGDESCAKVFKGEALDRDRVHWPSCKLEWHIVSFVYYKIL
jgi:hypothetical protein